MIFTTLAYNKITYFYSDKKFYLKIMIIIVVDSFHSLSVIEILVIAPAH